MRKAIILLISLIPILDLAQPTGGKPPLTGQQVHSLTLLGELWGFLKYYHPAVAQGQQDWDSILIQKIPLYLGAPDKDAVNRLTADWLTETGSVPACPSCDNKVPDSGKFNLDLSWINEANFSREVVDRLQFLRDNRNQGPNRFVALQSYSLITHERAYNTPAFLYPAPAYRLLLLFRFWNIVQYFSPYKYLCGKDWKQVLEEKIPAFYAAADTVAYHLEYVRLITSLNDGHANFYATPVLRHYWGDNHYPPFGCRMIDGQLVVNKLYNDSLAALIRIKPGDVITAVNGEKVGDKMARLLEYVPASNGAARVEFFTTTYLFTGPDSNFVITKIRNGRSITDSFRMPAFRPPHSDPSTLPWRMLDGNIGYVNLGGLLISQVDSAMDGLAGAKGIIFDVRNYPYDTEKGLSSRLCAHPFVMARVTLPDLKYPGVFRYEKNRSPGSTNRHAYQGQVVLLADEISVSHSEWTLMTLQAATNATTIGSTTAGQDGNISQRIQLPGGLFSRFSTIGIYYPDGTPAQRTGVKIDITVNPTIRGLQEGRDEVLEAGINFIKANSLLK